VETKKEEGERERERQGVERETITHTHTQRERARERGREREGEERERDALLIYNAAPSSLVQDKGEYFVWLFNNRWRHGTLEVESSFIALVKLSHV
jgi:hypothetical protein